MPNDNTHTGIDWDRVPSIETMFENRINTNISQQHALFTWVEFEFVLNEAVRYALSRTPAEPKAGDDVPKFLRVLRAEPKAGDWGRLTDADPITSPSTDPRLSSAPSRAGDWEKELEDASWPSSATGAASVWLTVAKDILRRALSSAAPRITERKWISVDVDKPLPADGAVVIVESWMNEWRTDVVVWRKRTRWSKWDRRYSILLDRVPTPPPFTPTQEGK